MSRYPTLRARFFVAANGTCFKRVWPADMSRKHRAFVRSGGRCHYCGHPIGWTVKRGTIENGELLAAIDHVIPRSRGGQNTDDNLVSCCEPCNSRKGVSLLHELPDNWWARSA
jgi:5-methylcytosine-specific restriction endonuclease McrA